MIGSAGMKRAVHIEGRIRAEQDAARVDEIEVGAGDGRAQQAVDGRDRAAGDAADHVVDGIGAREGGALAGENVEVAETMEQIGPRVVPSSAPMAKSGPLSAPAGPTLPSRTICAFASARKTSATRQTSANNLNPSPFGVTQFTTCPFSLFYCQSLSI